MNAVVRKMPVSIDKPARFPLSGRLSQEEAWFRAKACSKSCQISRGSDWSVIFIRFIAMRFAVPTTASRSAGAMPRKRLTRYRACLGILRLEKMYSKPRLEAASQRAVQLQAFSYRSLKSILNRSLDRQLLLDPETGGRGPRHENLRGPFYYNPPTKLVQ